MEISYKRTHKESYMIISTEEYVSDYEEQMLKENEIRSLLSFYTMERTAEYNSGTTFSRQTIAKRLSATKRSDL